MHTKFKRLLSKSLTTLEVMTYYIVVHTGPGQQPLGSSWSHPGGIRSAELPSMYQVLGSANVCLLAGCLTSSPWDNRTGYLLILSYLSRSLADHWGTTVDFTTSFLHSSRFSAFRSMMFHWRPVHSLMLSSHRFLCLPLRLPPWTVPCRRVPVVWALNTNTRSSGPGAIISKPRATHTALTTCNTHSAHHVQHTQRSPRATHTALTTCNTHSAHHVQRVACHLARRDSSAITVGRV